LTIKDDHGYTNITRKDIAESSHGGNGGGGGGGGGDVSPPAKEPEKSLCFASIAVIFIPMTAVGIRKYKGRKK